MSMPSAYVGQRVVHNESSLITENLVLECACMALGMNLIKFSL